MSSPVFSIGGIEKTADAFIPRVQKCIWAAHWGFDSYFACRYRTAFWKSECFRSSFSGLGCKHRTPPLTQDTSPPCCAALIQINQSWCSADVAPGNFLRTWLEHSHFLCLASYDKQSPKGGIPANYLLIKPKTEAANGMLPLIIAPIEPKNGRFKEFIPKFRNVR